jgi:diacylglycerol kinase family enzyme
MKILLIGNPAAGKVQGKAKIGELIQLLQQRGVRLETFLTRHPGDAKRRAFRWFYSPWVPLM